MLWDIFFDGYMESWPNPGILIDGNLFVDFLIFSQEELTEGWQVLAQD